MKYLKYFIPIWGLGQAMKEGKLDYFDFTLLTWIHLIMLCGIIYGAYKLIQLL